MRTITLVTGNENKLREWRRLVPDTITLESADIDLDELQSLDLTAIIEAKARTAYEKVGKPVVVEDIAAGLDELNGLPGPFIKFFEIQLGEDALHKLVKQSPAATVTCMIGYYDGKDALTITYDVHGNVVPMRTSNGFGFDCVFVPDGQTKTYAEMTPQEKDIVSHRAGAIKDFVAQLKKL